MFDFDPFDMDFDGDVDGIDFLGFDYLMRSELGVGQDEDDETAVGDEAQEDETPWER